MLADRIGALLADRCYDPDVIRGEIAHASVEMVVDRLSNGLEYWRQVATRHDK